MSQVNTTVPWGFQQVNVPLSIAINTSESPAIDLAGNSLVGVQMPAALTSTAMTFEVASAIDGTYVPLKTTTSGSALSYTVAASGYYAIDPKDFAGVRFLKIKMGSTETAARALLLSLKGI